jgi:putative cardiolipin synthase
VHSAETTIGNAVAATRRLATALLALLLVGCASLPPPQGRTSSSALAATEASDTPLGRTIAPLLAAHPGKTGVYPTADPRDAFAARIAVADAAQRTLDVQYYIWRADQSGLLVFEALVRAAARGVRVRLLLDDLNTKGLDVHLANAAVRRNFEVRLYNPLVIRSTRMVNFVTDFSRVNRRMHNKSFTADSQVSVIGGRNIGNEYFGTGAGKTFADLDVMIVGAAVAEVSSAFDLYWNSPSSYPADGFLGAPAHDADAALDAAFAAARADNESITYLAAVASTPLTRELAGGGLSFEWADATLVRDDPAKTLDDAARRDLLLLPALLQAAGRPQRTLDIVSPYFVPGDDGTAALAAIARRGVKVRILTNSLAATDESIVYAGYAKRRKPLLEAGVRIFELKPTRARDDDDVSGFRYGRNPASALHAKTFSVDDTRVFVGSFNFDLRSAQLNTEMGLVVESTLARRLGVMFDTETPLIAYEVRLAADGSLEWVERTPGGDRLYSVDPGTSWTLRRKVDLMAILPIEWLL